MSPLRTGDAVDEIAATLDDAPGRLACLSSHGRTGLGAVVLGSVAESLVHDRAGPILVCGPRAAAGAVPAHGGTLLAALDGTAGALGVVAEAGALARALGLAVHVAEVTAVEERVPQVPDHPATVASEDLRAAAARFGDLGLDATCDVLHGHDPARSIVHHAEQLPAAVVALTTHARRSLDRVAIGSVAMDVVRRSPCPVLLARSGA